MSTHATRRAIAFAALVAAFVTARGANADGEEEDLNATLNENVVSGASKSAETASDAPATTVTLTAGDMKRYGIRSLDEAIDFLGMGLVTQNPLHSVEVAGRGVLLTSDFGNHVLLVVDGHVMNEGWDGTAYYEQGAAIPLELIDHIELVLGAGSVLYGGSAMLGVINVVTKKAANYKGLHLIGEGSASPAHGIGGRVRSFAPRDLGSSYRIATGIGHEFKLFGKPAELTGQVELYHQSGPSFEWALQPSLNSSGAPYDWGPRAKPGVWGGRTTESYWTTVPAAHFKLVVGDFTTMFRAATYRRATPYVNGFNQFTGDFDHANNYELDRWLQLDVQWRKHVTERLGLMARYYADTYDYQQPLHSSDPDGCVFSLGGPCRVKTIGASRWTGLELQATQDWLGDDRLTTMLGLDARIRYVGAKTDSQDAATGQQLGSVGNKELTEIPWAAYLQQRWTPLKRLFLNGGVRFDRDPRGGQRFSPRAAAVIDTWRGGTFKAIYSTAFRAPTFYEAFYATQIQTPSPDIRSETVRSAEAVVETKWGANRVLFGLFRTWWNDMIALRLLDDGLYQYQNVSTIDNWGYNGQFEGQTGELRYGFSLTAAYTRRDGGPMTVTPSVFGNARVSYDLPGALPVVALATSFVGRRLADRANDGGFPETPTAPQQMHLRLTLSDKFPGHEALSWRISANYATVGVVPYVAGPTQAYDPTVPDAPRTAALAPVNRFTAFATLQYDFAL
ncbi:MAG: TonB-dependent receptor [Deltaproteobacteria bacterium]|nr:TonB-dependent receptor [Deltaproteobacteria bacterium]